MSETLTIDVVSDVVCPWCFLGKRRLERALSQNHDIETKVKVRWRPFQLDATIPPEGITRREYLEKKFGSVEAREPTYQHMAEMGRNEGIDYRFDKISRSPNTLGAHRLIGWARSAGGDDAMVERLFRAYFTDGADIGDEQTLATIAEELGFDRDAVARRLASDEDRIAVEEEISHAHRLGITGVPCFVVADRYAVMGAQSPEVIAQAIRRAAEEKSTGAT